MLATFAIKPIGVPPRLLSTFTGAQKQDELMRPTAAAEFYYMLRFVAGGCVSRLISFLAEEHVPFH